MSGSASHAAVRKYLFVLFGFLAGFVTGFVACSAFSAPLATWNPELSAGDIVGGLLNLTAILALPFLVDALREKKNREQQLLEGWAVEALTAIRASREAFDQGLPGPVPDELFSTVRRELKRSHELLSTIEHALVAWQYSPGLKANATAISEALGSYEHAVGEKSPSPEEIKEARSCYAKLRKELIEFLPLLRS